jgi:hypothetical protein
MTKILIFIFFIQNETLKTVANLGMLVFANTLCLKMFAIQVVGAKFLVEVQKNKPKAVHRFRRILKVRPRHVVGVQISLLKFTNS